MENYSIDNIIYGFIFKDNNDLWYGEYINNSHVEKFNELFINDYRFNSLKKNQIIVVESFISNEDKIRIKPKAILQLMENDEIDSIAEVLSSMDFPSDESDKMFMDIFSVANITN